MAIPDLRREYSRGGLDRQDLNEDPLAQFTNWFAHASAARGGTRLRKIGIKTRHDRRLVNSPARGSKTRKWSTTR